MTKFLKRTISIFLSFSVLAFRGPTYFGCWAGQTGLDDIGQSGSSGGQDKPKLSEAERAYQFRKIQSVDLSRSTDNTDHSKVVVSTADFFLYPPKSVKELFEVKDKEAAFHYRDAMLCTNVAELGNGKGKVARVGILFGRSIATVITFLAAVTTLLFSVNSIEIAQDYRNQDSSELNSEELKLSNQMRIGGKIGCALSAFLVLVAVYNLYALCSKTCCDCYVCKTSDAGCSCCYGCDGCDDGRGCVGCIDCCNCGEKLKCCPCDNGGFALDWCGRYGIVGTCCGGRVYEELEGDLVKSVKDFKPLVKEMINTIRDRKLEGKLSKCFLFLAKPSLEFKKSNGKFNVDLEFNGKGIGSDVIPDQMLPKKAAILVGHLLSSNFPCSQSPEAVADWRVFGNFYDNYCEEKFYEKFKESRSDIDGVIDSIYEQLYNNKSAREIILEVCDKDIESGKNEEIKKFIFAILAFCRYAIGEISTLDNFSKVRLCNYFNFIQAVAEQL